MNHNRGAVDHRSVTQHAHLQAVYSSNKNKYTTRMIVNPSIGEETFL